MYSHALKYSFKCLHAWYSLVAKGAQNRQSRDQREYDISPPSHRGHDHQGYSPQRAQGHRQGRSPDRSLDQAHDQGYSPDQPNGQHNRHLHPRQYLEHIGNWRKKPCLSLWSWSTLELLCFAHDVSIFRLNFYLAISLYNFCSIFKHFCSSFKIILATILRSFRFLEVQVHWCWYANLDLLHQQYVKNTNLENTLSHIYFKELNCIDIEFLIILYRCCI